MLEKHTVCGWAVLGEIGQQGESKVQNIHFQFHCCLPKACLAVQYRDATFRCSLIHSGLPQHVITFFFNLHLRCSVQQFFYTKKTFFVIKLKNSCILFSTKSHFNAQQLKGNQLWITDKRKNIQSIKYLRVYDLLCLELSLEMFFPSAAGALCLWTAVAWLTKLRRGF